MTTTRRLTLRIGLMVMALAVVGLTTLPSYGKAPDPSSPEFPKYVMRKLDDQFRGEKSYAKLKMKVKTERWTRSMALEAWTLGTNYSLVRIRRPRKEKGTASLKAKNELFTYLSKTGRTIKITSGMMGGSWMGSHFTNDDLMQHVRLSRDFRIVLSFKGKRGDTPIYRFTLTPKPDAPVVWGKIDITVRKKDLLPVSQTYYDEDGAKVRRLTFSRYKKLGGRLRPTKLLMQPLDGSGEYTKIVYKKLDFKVKLKKSFFTLQRLKSLK